MIRVALVFGSYPPRRNGGADFLGRFSLALAEAGALVTVVTSRGSRPEREEVASGVTVHRIVEGWGPGQSVARVNRLLERERVQVVHVFFPDSELGDRLELMAAVGAPRLPLVTTFWNLGLGRRSPMRIRLTASALLVRSRALTSHDPAYLAVLRRVAAGRTVAWLPVGNNVGTAAPPGSSARPTLAYFGQVDFTRGLEDLFEALRLVRRGRDVGLVLLGSAGREERYADDPAVEAYYRGIRALPAELGIEDAVEWTGYLEDAELAARLRAADLCVLPYRRNSVGRSALAAALELGVPTVLAGGAADVAPLRPGVHVALVPRAEPGALAATLEELLARPEERARLAAGACRAARLFAWPRIASGALAVYRRVLACA